MPRLWKQLINYDMIKVRFVNNKVFACKLKILEFTGKKDCNLQVKRLVVYKLLNFVGYKG